MVRRWAFTIAVWMLAGCGAATPGDTCQPGEARACTCGGGIALQLCGADGTYGVCVCNAAATDVPSGGTRSGGGGGGTSTSDAGGGPTDAGMPADAPARDVDRIEVAAPADAPTRDVDRIDVLQWDAAPDVLQWDAAPDVLQWDAAPDTYESSDVVVSALYHGWSSPIPGCRTTSYDAAAPTNQGGYYPYNIGDSDACRAWKLAATVCTTPPVMYNTTDNWTCPVSGGFTAIGFGTYCRVNNQYACSTCPGACNAGCTYRPLSLRNCSGAEASQQ